ncbi:hypothetical protein Y1Q_0024175 [Alligator mississippiensis]|uniref:Uncharacterized protein n=1 Tax=Alligator mississippiensis TaxID=8496 RepID=A0A151NI48_ALLMI|nr:hypothetical protein Y1Q_0024175 [Alligator mississippiensis]
MEMTTRCGWPTEAGKEDEPSFHRLIRRHAPKQSISVPQEESRRENMANHWMKGTLMTCIYGSLIATQMFQKTYHLDGYNY